MDDLPPAKPALAQRAASGVIWITLEMGTTQGISLLIFAVLARFVTPTDFGLISISYLAIYTFKALVIDNIVIAVSRKQHPSDLEYTTSFWLTLALAALAAIAVFLSAEMAEQLMSAPGLKEVMRAMSIILLFLGLARTHEMRLVRNFEFRTLALRSVAGTVTGGAIGIILAAYDYGVTALVVQQIITTGISLALLWTFSSWTPSLRVSREVTLETLLFMRSIAPSSVLNVVNQNCDMFLVAYFFGPASAGVYAIAKRLRLALQLAAVTPISGVLFSTLAELQGDRDRLKHVSRRLIALISLVCAPIFVGSSSIAREAISLAFGTQWAGAGPVFAVLTLGGFFAALQNFCDTIFILKNRQIWSFYLLLIQTVLAVLIFFPIKFLGPDYMAAPFMLPYLITFPLSALLVSRITGLSLSAWATSILPAVTSSALMFVTVKLIDAGVTFPSNLAQVLFCSASGALVYSLGIMIADRSTAISALQLALKRIS
jgi:lipopolysaccharide exporter